MSDAAGGSWPRSRCSEPDAGDSDAVAAGRQHGCPACESEPPGLRSLPRASRSWTPQQPGGGQAEGDEDWRALLLPLALAQDALARLETAAALASEPVRNGLVARVALHEAAGWLAHHGAWVSATDLALRDAGVVGAWGVAEHAGRLAHEMPTTAATTATSGIAGPSGRFAACPPGGSLRDGSAPDGVPDDRLAGHALLLARHWRELAEPDAAFAGRNEPEREGLRRALAVLGRGGLGDDEWRGWLALIGEDEGLPPLVRAARLAARWQEERAAAEGRADLLLPAALFLAASVWRGRRPDALPLPLWSAPPTMLHALALKRAGAGWTAALLAVAAEATRRAHGELRRLQDAERRGLALADAVTTRSRLPAALEIALRSPVLTPATLAARVGVSTRAGLALVDRLVRAGVLREATGRGAWRAYAIAA